ncbi:Xaa-Pro dipeptidase [Novosphingobium nitrogenifigens DSM 19370]|uniref:Xaa-Pro aminopeptidase n=1 Tax=Novosphingobium nitrogenifigens DSM 19370 TaxID=983920 RepID=F1ZCT0_9SPHN|nr:aminopeptidase P N-terminal domain-containing protein [Novosphingobium nitrogenifigens]EGD57614.1 Xaa-Pro dipeptidase [Novosphingobium nitrogenifigens DSM 19370]
MFEAATYRQRRASLAQALPDALILIPGNAGMPMDFAVNHHPFVQDGCFRYFFGIDEPDLVGLVDGASGEAWLFGEDGGIDAAVWTGVTPSVAERAAQVGAGAGGDLAACAAHLARAQGQGRTVAYTPPYTAEILLLIAGLVGITPEAVRAGASPALVRAIVTLREIKSAGEIAEMEAALAVTARMHHAAMAATRPGVREHHVVGCMAGIARGADLNFAYAPILSGRGEVLHNLRYDRTLATGELVVNDTGVKSAGGYASDITRTFPVSGRFDPLQRRLYDTVLRAQQAAIAACVPGVRYLDLHWLAARIMVEDLHDLGLFRGAIEDVLASGAYALAFPCGLGHQIGLDVHDMEALGEDLVGYDGDVRRSDLFGLRSLRLGKALRAGMTVTIEPGLYFIPPLIDRWRGEGRHSSLIDYDAFDRLRGFGGIRIEDDVHVGENGARILGDPIGRTADEVEAVMAAA